MIRKKSESEKWKNFSENQGPTSKQLKILNKEAYEHSYMKIKSNKQGIMNKPKVFTIITIFIAVSFFVLGCTSKKNTT
jgi:hypothetical protein